MTRKDYVLLAAALASVRPTSKAAQHEPILAAQHKVDCAAIADALGRDNPRFDTLRFLKACGLT